MKNFINILKGLIWERIKFDEKNIEEYKDDDTTTNNDSFEDECNLLDKKKFK